MGNVNATYGFTTSGATADSLYSWQDTGQVAGTIYEISRTINGNGFAIAAGLVSGNIAIPETGEISQIVLLSDVDSTTVLDLWLDSYANYPPTVDDSISGTTKIQLSAGKTAKDSTLTGWDKTVTRGDIMRVNVDSNDNATNLTLILTITRS